MKNRPELKRLGSQIRNIRTATGRTQIDLASACKMNRNYFGMLERGERNPTYLVLLKVAKGLNVSLADLFPKEN